MLVVIHERLYRLRQGHIVTVANVLNNLDFTGVRVTSNWQDQEI